MKVFKLCICIKNIFYQINQKLAFFTRFDRKFPPNHHITMKPMEAPPLLNSWKIYSFEKCITFITKQPKSHLKKKLSNSRISIQLKKKPFSNTFNFFPHKKVKKSPKKANSQTRFVYWYYWQCLEQLQKFCLFILQTIPLCYPIQAPILLLTFQPRKPINQPHLQCHILMLHLYQQTTFTTN